jgi:DNA-binding MarR family transcriptional regulator
MKTEPEIFETCGFRILSAIRRIIRAVDIHSRKLHTEFDVTTPQMICIYALLRNDGITLSELSKAVSLSASTVNGIVDRLESKELMTRQRSSEDRRKVLLRLTDKGRQITREAPSLLQDRLSSALQSLPELEQVTIAMSLERIVGLMEAQHLETSPNLLPAEDIQHVETDNVPVLSLPKRSPPG